MPHKRPKLKRTTLLPRWSKEYKAAMSASPHVSIADKTPIYGDIMTEEPAPNEQKETQTVERAPETVVSALYKNLMEPPEDPTSMEHLIYSLSQSLYQNHPSIAIRNRKPVEHYAQMYNDLWETLIKKYVAK